MRIWRLGIICLFLVAFSILLSNQYVFAEDVSVTSNTINNKTILEIKNDRKSDVEIDSIRIWLSGDAIFESFKTQKGWMGEINQQGVITFASSGEGLKSGQTLKFSLVTTSDTPVINWKAIDDNGNVIESSSSISTKTEGENVDELKSGDIAILDSSTFRTIPEKLRIDSSFRLVGQSFASNQDLDFYLNDNKLKSFNTDSNGNFVVTIKISDDTKPERTDFTLVDSTGNEKSLSLRIADASNRLLSGKLIKLSMDNTPENVKRGDTITFNGKATPSSTLTITTKDYTNSIITKDIVKANTDGEWSFNNIFTTDLELGQIFIEITEGSDMVSRSFVIESSKIINISALQQRYEPSNTMAFSGMATPNQDLEIVVEDPTGAEIFSSVISVGPDGEVSFSVPTDRAAIKGTYAVFLTQAGVEEVELVGIGELPQSKIIVKPSSLNFAGNSNATFTIKGPAGANVALIIIDDSDTEKLSDNVLIGPDGKALFETSLLGWSSGVYSIDLRHANARASELFAIGMTTGSGEITMKSVKESYLPGSSILIMGNTGPNSLLTISLTNNEGITVKRVDAFSDKNGLFVSDKLRISANAEPGIWNIIVKSGANVAEQEITIGQEVEGMILYIDSKQIEFRHAEIIQIKGTGAEVSHSVRIDIIKPNGDSITADPFTMVSTNDGTFSLTWQVPTDIESGEYTIIANDGINEANLIMKIV